MTKEEYRQEMLKDQRKGCLINIHMLLWHISNMKSMCSDNSSTLKRLVIFEKYLSSIEKELTEK